MTTLKPRSAWHTNFYALAHNSLANYVGMTSGQYILCDQNDDPPDTCHQNAPNLFHQLDVAGVSWQSWMESMPVACDVEKESGTLQDSNTYRVKHNPAVYYDNVEGAGGVWSATNKSAECLANVIPAGGTGHERHQRLRLGAWTRQRRQVQPGRAEPMRGRATTTAARRPAPR